MSGKATSLTIGLDCTVAGVRDPVRSGIYRYLKHLILGLQAVGDGYRYCLWFNSFRRAGREGVDYFHSTVKGPSITTVVSRLPGRVRERLRLPAEWFTGSIDLFHGPSHLLPLLRRPRAVVTIHDLTFLQMTEELRRLNPRWCSAINLRSPHPDRDLLAYRARCDFFLNLRQRIHGALNRADAIIAVSEATARDLAELAHVPRAKICVIPNGLTPGMSSVEDRARIQEAKDGLGIEGRYVLYVGVLDPNKDLHTLIGAFARTSSAFRREHQLVIVGARNWFRPVLEEEVDRQGVGKRVRFTGFVPDNLLPALYGGAAVVISPSPFEGFGFPVLEAMACGTPVIVANAGALPEIAGDAAIRVRPREPSALAEAMERLCGDRELAADLRERGLLRCREFSWERTARMTLEVYNEVVGR